MPLVYRAMRRDGDGLPSLGRSATTLGVRIGPDIDVDAAGNVTVNNKGMSVAPGWRDLPIFRRPRRLGGQGRDDTYCFRSGSGDFQASAFATGLEFLPDSPTHGVIRPTQAVPLTQYEADLGATRETWQIDEA